MLSNEDILAIPRRKVRYHLYRLRTFMEGGPPTFSDQFKVFYEHQHGFTTWSGFAREWDVDIAGKHYKIIKRGSTEEQEWNNQLASLVR